MTCQYLANLIKSCQLSTMWEEKNRLFCLRSVSLWIGASKCACLRVGFLHVAQLLVKPNIVKNFALTFISNVNPLQIGGKPLFLLHGYYNRIYQNFRVKAL